jgi:hypothetical protein
LTCGWLCNTKLQVRRRSWLREHAGACRILNACVCVCGCMRVCKQDLPYQPASTRARTHARTQQLASLQGAFAWYTKYCTVWTQSKQSQPTSSQTVRVTFVYVYPSFALTPIACTRYPYFNFVYMYLIIIRKGLNLVLAPCSLLADTPDSTVMMTVMQRGVQKGLLRTQSTI